MPALYEIVPPVPLVPAPYGLISLRDPAVTGDERWLAGMSHESLECEAELNLLDMCNGFTAVSAIVRTETDPFRNYTPFVVEAIDKCTTFGYTQRDVEARAVAALEAGTQKAIEFEFWTGTQAQANGYTNNRYLAAVASQDVTPVGGGPAKVRYGLAALEAAIASCGVGTRGTIHATPEVGSVLPLKEVDGHLETQLGNLVVVGTGYTGTGPNGTQPVTGTWMYATGPVSVRLGKSEALGVKLKQQVDTSTNTWETHATRAAAVYWDGCCVFAAHVDLALDYA